MQCTAPQQQKIGAVNSTHLTLELPATDSSSQLFIGMLPYQYQPLQYDDSVRILVLHPSVDNSDPIKCTIQQARLSDASLEYEALSYTWGDTAQTQAVHLDNGERELFVRENCHNALWHLRYTDAERLLWIDAICIDQDNLQERSKQVRMMEKNIQSRIHCRSVFKRACCESQRSI